MLLAPLAVLALPGTFGRYIEHFRQRGQLKSFLLRVGIFSVVTTGALMAALVLFAPQFAQLFFRNADQSSLVWALAFALGLVGALNFFSCLIEALRQIRLVTIMRFVAGVSFALASVVLLIGWNANAELITIGFGVSCLIGIIPAAWFLIRHWNNLEETTEHLPQRNMWSRIAPFAMWLWLTNLATNLYEVSDRYMLLQLLPMSATDAQGIVGQYHSARVVPLIMVSLAAVLGGILLPYMSAAWEEKRFKDAKLQLSWTFKLTGFGFAAGSILIVIASPLLFKIILQGRYDDGLAILPMTLTYCIWYSMVLVGQDFLWCKNQGKWLFIAYLFGLAINIGLNLFLIPAYGLSGAVWGTFISNIICLLCLMLFSQWQGFNINRGIWIALLVPLVVLLHPLIAALILLVTMWAGVRYRWVFDNDEVEQLASFARMAAAKVGWSPAKTSSPSPN